MTPIIGLLIHLLVLVLVLAIVVWVAGLAVSALGLPPVALTIVQAICGLIVLLWLVQVVLGTGPPWRIWPR